MPNIDISDTGERVTDLLRTNARTKSVPRYWPSGVLPTPLPPKFFVITPLFPTVGRAGSVHTVSSHTVQVTACAEFFGDATDLLDAAFHALPSNEFGTFTFGPVLEVSDHYEVSMTVTRITGATSADLSTP